VGTAGVDTREPSLPIDLVARKPESVRPPPAAPASLEARAPSVPPEPAPAVRDDHAPDAGDERAERDTSVAPTARRRSGRGWLLLLVLVACGASGYVFRDRLLPFWRVAISTIARRLH